MKKQFPALLGVILAVAVSAMSFEGLEQDGVAALSILIFAIVYWIYKVLPDFVTALLMATGMILICDVPVDVMFSAFSQSSLWLLFASYTLSLGVTKCGLMNRISLYILNLFPGTFFGQMLGMITAGTVIGPFIPNMSAKVMILAPLSHSISRSMGYKDKSQQANGLFLSMLTGVRTAGPLLISASVLGYAFLGLYPEQVASHFTMLRWFLNALPWYVTVTVLNSYVLFKRYKPNNEEQLNKAEISQRISMLGEMSKKEKQMLVIICGTMFLWITEAYHNIPAYLVAIVSMSLTVAFGVVELKEYYAEMNWGALLFMGIILGIAPVFSYLGIDQWLVLLLRPMLESVSTNPWLLIVGIALLTILLRFVIVAELTAVNILMLILIPLAADLQINPWVIGFAVYAVITPWFFVYQNPVYMAAYYTVGEEMVQQREMSQYCLIYLLICMLGLLVSVTVWIANGTYYSVV